MYADLTVGVIIVFLYWEKLPFCTVFWVSLIRDYHHTNREILLFGDSAVALEVRIVLVDIAHVTVFCVLKLIFHLNYRRVFSILLHPSV